MNDSVVEQQEISAKYVVVDEESLTVSLSDGRRLILPLDWYPRLLHGTPAERNNWRLVADGVGIHWPDLDEDLSVEAFLAGRRSIESPRSIKQWLAGRSKTRSRADVNKQPASLRSR